MPDWDDSAARQNRLVWLLGSDHSGADKSIGWDTDPFPNLSDPDVLIVDLTTLDRQVLERIGRAKLEQASQLIWDKILNGGLVIVITWPFFWVAPGFDLGDDAGHSPFDPYSNDPLVYSNYHILPTHLATKIVEDGRVISVDPGHGLGDYARNVRGFFFYIAGHTHMVVQDSPQSLTGVGLAAVEGQGIRDNSGHDLGLVLVAEDVDDYRKTATRRENSGYLVFLPPPTEPKDVAIGRILSVYKKSRPHAEGAPAWAERLTLGRAGEYGEKAAKLKENMEKMQVDIDGLERQAGEILAHRRLLYSDGTELEDAVVQAFRILGFDDIEQMAGADEEDAAFAMGGGTGYSHAVVEVKGARGAIQMQDINQCNRWTDQRAESDGALPKGILIPNQHRQKPYPESSKARISIEPNQRKRAEMKDICIIPSCVLFEAVRRVLGGEAPDREKTTAKIAGCRGVLTDVL